MGRPRVIVLRAPGINCDEETQYAWTLAGADCDLVHLQRLAEAPALLERYAILTLPGGFSYGDDVSAGRIFANRLRHSLGDRLRSFLDRGRLILGICNGFQVLVKAGLLSVNDAGGRGTLGFNEDGVFTARWVTVEAQADHCAFLERGRRYFLPIAHAEGRFVVRPGEAIDPRRVALRYVEGVRREGPANPNGSWEDVAALTDPTGRILGLMPHPERFVERTQHPFWTALGGSVEPDGLRIFRAAVGRVR